MIAVGRSHIALQEQEQPLAITHQHRAVQSQFLLQRRHLFGGGIRAQHGCSRVADQRKGIEGEE